METKFSDEIDVEINRRLRKMEEDRKMKGSVSDADIEDESRQEKIDEIKDIIETLDEVSINRILEAVYEEAIEKWADSSSSTSIINKKG